MSVWMIMSSSVDPGRVEEFEAAFALVRTRVAGVPGHVQEDLFRDADAPGEYLLVSQWCDRSAFLRWLHSPEHDVMTAEMRPCFARRSTLRFFEDAAQSELPRTAEQLVS